MVLTAGSPAAVTRPVKMTLPPQSVAGGGKVTASTAYGGATAYGGMLAVRGWSGVCVGGARVWFAVLVHGPSMVPTLRHGDALLVRRGGRGVRVGDVVVARFRARPDLLVVKRAVRPQDGGWWVGSDNELVTDDSWVYGVADVVGRVVCRYWPRPARIRRRGSLPG